MIEPERDELTQDGSRFIRRRWDRSESLTTAIVEATAEATGEEVEDLPPLQRRVDVDAVNALFTSKDSNAGDLHLSFDYAGAVVSVDGDGELVAWPAATAYGTKGFTPRTEAELDTTLQELLWRAFHDGVGVEGGFEIRNGTSLPDWDVHISRVAKRDGSDI